MKIIMRIIENGNVFKPHKPTNENFNSNDWPTNIEANNTLESRSNNSLFNSNCNAIYGSTETTETFVNYTSVIENLDTKVNVEFTVCNRQFRINAQNNSCNTFKLNNLEEDKDIKLINRGRSREESDVYSDESPIDDDRVFDHSDTDEMSERGIHLVGPRGIVNPNYPGFQHLAHTLQDYSSNIENFYQSENDMTDDDADIEITELTYEPDDSQKDKAIECQNNNNNINKDESLENDLYPETKTLGSKSQNDMPDLIQTLTKQNNNNEVDLFSYELNCSDADIENNFYTKDIIGDFNKEVEDEIKQLLNYNINIQDDLEELRKDIKDTLAKPIENTINNISDVVNHVIKKLVETQSDSTEEAIDYKTSDTNHTPSSNEEEIAIINKENEKNTRTEMHLSRPTFLYIDKDPDTKIVDAILSDGKDEIDVSKYEPDKLSQNVENTIKQLSTELRKIIPKLDEMRQRDRLWAECKRETVPVVREEVLVATDGNSNEIKKTSNGYDFVNASIEGKTESSVNYRHSNSHIAHATVRNLPVKSQIESRVSRDRLKDVASSKNCYHNAHSNSSVLKNDSGKDFDLGSFDVYNIETALPKLDIDTIENHLRAAKEAERRKRNDREEIRKRLAMGAEAEEYYSLGYTDRPGKKPSLHSRLQSGMNLQICFMNETASDNESQALDLDRNVNSNTKSLSRTNLFNKNSYNHNHPYQTRPLSVNITKHDKISTVQSGAKLRPSTLSIKTKSRSSHSLNHIEVKESDFFALQATLQTEARMALAQAKEMARIQMERERRSRAVSPVTEMLRRSMDKANAPLAADRRRVSRQLLTDMNIAQLQVIVNELHSQIEGLNDTLVKLLMARDELHMGQDSMLVDIEDLTRYLKLPSKKAIDASGDMLPLNLPKEIEEGVKEQTKKTKGTTKTGMKRLTSLVHK